MNGAEGGRSDVPPDLCERQTLCISRPKPDYVLHCGDDGFKEELGTWYDTAESNAAEKTIKLKNALKQASTEEFWTMATEGLADITDAQYAFISKRMLVDEEDAAVEMPPLGEPGSCLMSQALYFNDGHGNMGNPRNVKYTAYGCPCAHMKHDKVFVIPERLGEVIPNNPNQAAFVVPVEGYLALPLSHDGRCFAHFGVMWSAEGLARRKLSFAYMEMMFHSLEDTILDGFLERGQFSKSVKAQEAKTVIPHEAVTVAQSLKPYARSLSHELRTPMQGVVGMLDVMYATVQEATEGQKDAGVRAMLQALKENIEMVQDSSRRAVEAADNVVHAYDMNMGVPEAPISPPEDDSGPERTASRDRRPEIVVTGDHVPITLKNHKRRRNSLTELPEKGSKRIRTDDRLSRPSSHQASHVSNSNTPVDYSLTSEQGAEDVDLKTSSKDSTSRDNGLSYQVTPGHAVPHGLRNTNLREMLQFLVNESLKVGGRPDSAIAEETEFGEEIEVRVRAPDGREKVTLVKWAVDPTVPETIVIDEKDLQKMISCVFLNAIKFTEEGQVTLTVRLSPRLRYIVINIRDTGPGIPEAFLPNLFKPFAKEDDSTTRASEGLGLGLLVAKGLARKLGGDLTCVRADTSGPNRGTEFEMRVPCTPSDTVSRPYTPFSSPTPSRLSLPSPDLEGPAPFDAIDNHLLHTVGHGSPQPPSRRRHRSNSRKSRSPPDRRANQVTSAQPNRSPPTVTHSETDFDRKLAQKYPLTFLVVEDNKINRRLLVNMLKKLGYNDIYEAYDGADAVRAMERLNATSNPADTVDHEKSGGSTGKASACSGKMIDVVLMDLWMPYMDGYEATEKILSMNYSAPSPTSAGGPVNDGPVVKIGPPTILAVTADVTSGALERAEKVGMKGFLSKPYKLRDLQKLILEYCASASSGALMET